MAIPPFGSPPTPDSSSTKKGKVKLTNDLGGTADLPQITNLHLSGDTAINHKLTSLTDPTSPQDAASKNYVDNKVSGLEHKDSCDEATIAALPSLIYNNGSSGVGATLTGVAFGALSVDGTTVSIGQRILVKNQAATAQNGIYTVTATGGIAAVFVLTRATDFDGSGDIIDSGDTTYITAGATLHGTTWTVDSGAVTTVGTDPITWVQTAGPGALIGGNAISISGNTINADVDGVSIEISADALRRAALTGDVSATAGSNTLTLATVATGATVGDATHIPVVTFNNKGLITNVTTATPSATTQRTFAYFAG